MKTHLYILRECMFGVSEVLNYDCYVLFYIYYV
jgi:hypothetical protein